MLKIDMGTPGQKDVIMASGSFHDIFAQVCTVVADLYKQMKVSAPPLWPQSSGEALSPP